VKLVPSLPEADSTLELPIQADPRVDKHLIQIEFETYRPSVILKKPEDFTQDMHLSEIEKAIKSIVLVTPDGK